MESLELESNMMKTDLLALQSTTSRYGNSAPVSAKEIETETGNNEKIHISIAEPVMLSTHLYLEALQEKINEINELRRAFVDLAVCATNESVQKNPHSLNLLQIKKEIDIKINDKKKSAYKNQYISDALKKIKRRIEKDKSKSTSPSISHPLDHDEEFNLIIKSERTKFDDLYSRYKKEVSERRYLHNKLEDLKGNIRVYCRVRALIKDESNTIPLQSDPYITFPDAHSIRVCHLPNKRDLTFELNHVFTHTDDQNLVFEEVDPLISSVLDGYNACIMAYGQTGAGKTYTMLGSETEKGVIPRAIHSIFDKIRGRIGDYDYQVCLSIVEIYNEQVRDLLSSNPSKQILRKFDFISCKD